MKTAFSIVSSLIGLGFSSQAFASPYPPHFCDQSVRVLHQGPALFAHVSSGCDTLEAIGYQASGALAADNPEYIDAVVTTSCGYTDSHTTVIRLGREWHGTGYMSQSHTFYNYFPQGCNGKDYFVSVAFSANGKWDSRNGANYYYEGEGFLGNRDALVYRTGQAGFGNISMAAWDAIIGEMKRQ